MYTGIIREYLRKDKFPSIWCPGCGHGIVLASLLRAIYKIGWEKNDIVLVSGIGCAGRIPGYVDFNTLHTTHGRALAFATGIKMAKPHLHVIAVMGDGDAVAIGGNHFIHTARRNIDITAIVYNNAIYGMTGGQVSPTTPMGAKASTAPYGMIEKPFDIVELALGSGATFVARGSSYHVPMLDNLIKKALEHKGFSVVDVITSCPTTYGRRNRLTDDPVKNLEWVKTRLIPVSQWEKLDEKEKKDKLPFGIFRDENISELTEIYEKMEKTVRGEK